MVLVALILAYTFLYAKEAKITRKKINKLNRIKLKSEHELFLKRFY